MTFAEFFAGIGLVRLGLEKSEWQCKFANDIDAGKLEMYGAQFPDWRKHFFLGDVRLIEPGQIPGVDLATASFPCTDLSLAGGRAGLAGRHSSALWPFLDLLGRLESRRPKLVLLENVPGLLTSHNGADLTDALLALNRLGYVVDAFILDAVCFVPQSRRRLFVVAVQGKIVGARLSESLVRPASLRKFVSDHPEIVWNLKELPDPPLPRNNLPSILEALPDDAREWWPAARIEYLLAQMSERHRSQVESMCERKEIGVGTVFRRLRNGRSMAELRTDGVAGCLRTPKGGSAKQILLFAGGGRRRVRLMTPRECARLMGADEFAIEVGSTQALFGFGDAVCVPVIDWIATHYLNPVLGNLEERQGALLGT